MLVLRGFAEENFEKVYLSTRKVDEKLASLRALADNSCTIGDNQSNIAECVVTSFALYVLGKSHITP